MTLAICIKCGHEKLGAWTPCRRCGFLPNAEEERAKSVLLSDHSLSRRQLRMISKKIKNGEAVSFDQASLEELVGGISMLEPKYVLGVRVTSWIALCVAVLIGLLLGFCFTGIFSHFG